MIKSSENGVEFCGDYPDLMADISTIIISLACDGMPYEYLERACLTGLAIISGGDGDGE